MHENKNSGRLLLLRVRTSSFAAKSRLQLRQHGSADDRSHKVVNLDVPTISTTDYLITYIRELIITNDFDPDAVYCNLSRGEIKKCCGRSPIFQQEVPMIISLPTKVNRQYILG